MDHPQGGIGLPLVFAVVFFVIFFLLTNFGRKLAGQAVLSPMVGMWLATYVLVPVGLFLTYKALNDSQLFNKEFYFRLSRNIRTLAARIREWKKQGKYRSPAMGRRRSRCSVLPEAGSLLSHPVCCGAY
ncbi:LptF/LptG family permease [Puia sp. P3]|uniref:LptF/LptG family permease n=1 Tax=Puia sp. P3 TaxID=3423952 RepID=UPI003D677F67